LPAQFAIRLRNGRVAPRSKSQSELFTWGLEQVLEEARNLRRVKHPNVVRVIRHFETLGTAFIVMDLVPGVTLEDAVASGGPWSEDRFRPLFSALLDACKAVHGEGLLHRDIKPANIILQPDGAPVLIDFGAARQVIFSRTQSVTALVTPGYGPLEQYSTKAKLGPATDIYGLAATSYYVLTGNEPEESIARVEKDELPPLVKVAKDRGSAGFLASVDLGMKVAAADRPQSIAEWVKKIPPAAPPRPQVEKTSQEPVRKSRVGLIAGVALLAICALGFILRPDPNAAAKAALAQITQTDWSVKRGPDLVAAALKGASVEEFRQLAEAGDARAETMMGLIYHVGAPNVTIDQVEATSWLRRAADQKNARALYDLGDVYTTNGSANAEREAEYFKQSAALGNGRGEGALGDSYILGRGVPKDPAQGVHWLEQAAAQGVVSSEAELGRIYYNGDIVTRSYERARPLLEKAAAEGDADAQHDLALAYYNGNGVFQNKYEASQLFAKSADQGNIDSKYMLGRMYFDGDGVLMDVIKGRDLINKAAAGNSVLAKNWVTLHPIFTSFSTPTIPTTTPAFGAFNWSTITRH
jgi:TPR repeat protein